MADSDQALKDHFTAQFDDLKKIMLSQTQDLKTETQALNKTFQSWSSKVEADFATHERAILQNQGEIRANKEATETTKSVVQQQAEKLAKAEQRIRDVTRRKYKK